jgi:hypothetical protein
MSEDNQALVLDLVEWVAIKPRLCCDFMEAWRTSCPRLTIWEDAQEQNLVKRYRDEKGMVVIAATEAGCRLLETSGRPTRLKA